MGNFFEALGRTKALPEAMTFLSEQAQQTRENAMKEKEFALKQQAYTDTHEKAVLETNKMRNELYLQNQEIQRQKTPINLKQDEIFRQLSPESQKNAEEWIYNGGWGTRSNDPNVIPMTVGQKERAIDALKKDPQAWTSIMKPNVDAAENNLNAVRNALEEEKGKGDKANPKKIEELTQNQQAAQSKYNTAYAAYHQGAVMTNINQIIDSIPKEQWNQLSMDTRNKISVAANIANSTGDIPTFNKTLGEIFKSDVELKKAQLMSGANPNPYKTFVASHPDWTKEQLDKEWAVREQKKNELKWEGLRASRKIDALDIDSKSPTYGRVIPTTIGESEKNPTRFISTQDSIFKAWRDNVNYERMNKNYVTTIEKYGNMAEQIMKKYNLNQNSKLLNYGIQDLIKNKAMGSGDVASLNLLLSGLKQEISKVESGSLGISGAYQSTAQDFGKSLNSNMPMQDLLKVMAWAKKAGNERLAAIKETTKDLKKELMNTSTETDTGTITDTNNVTTAKDLLKKYGY